MINKKIMTKLIMGAASGSVVKSIHTIWLTTTYMPLASVGNGTHVHKRKETKWERKTF